MRAEAWGDCKFRALLGQCLYGTGGWYEGYVDVTRIYVGDVAALEKQLTRKVESAFQAIRQVNSSRQVYFKNKCKFPIRLALRYRKPSDEWVTGGWWNFEGNEKAVLSRNQIRIRSDNSIFYYYAEITQEPHTNYRWSGDEEKKLRRRKLPMRQVKLSPDSDGDYVLSISCNNL